MRTLLPGEWITIDEDDAEEFWFRDGFSEVRTSDGELVCVAPAPNNVEKSRLLAAAPYMLEALENLENDDGERMPKTAWALVQSAIAKARGETQ